MKKIRIILWSLVFVVVISVGYVQYYTQAPSTEKQYKSKIGGDFVLVRQDGSKISHDDLLGKPHAIFFGFTSCPEVCPTTLFEMTRWLEKLGKDADRLGVYFVTVDPERDTSQVLGEYLSAFDSRITGITGEKDAVEKMLRSYKVYFKRVELDDGDYTMDHTALVYLLSAKGEFLRSIRYGADIETALAKLRLMLK